MPRVAVELDERAGVEQPLDALTREQLARSALPLDRLLAACVERLVAKLAKPLELLLGGVGHGRRA